MKHFEVSSFLRMVLAKEPSMYEDSEALKL